MNAFKFLAAATVFAAAGSAFAADVPAANVAATAAAVNVTALVANNIPAIQTVKISQQGWSTRAVTKAEAVDFARNHKTAFEVQIEQYKN